MAAVFKAQMTKLANGTIENVSAKTIGKGIVSDVVGGVYQQVTKTADKLIGISEAFYNPKPSTCLPANPHC